MSEGEVGEQQLSMDEIHRILDLPSQWLQGDHGHNHGHDHGYNHGHDHGRNHSHRHGHNHNHLWDGDRTPVRSNSLCSDGSVWSQGSDDSEVLGSGDVQGLLHLAQQLQAALHPHLLVKQQEQEQQEVSWAVVEPKQEPVDWEELCHVCGERAGKHSYYGGQVCASCRAFFRSDR